MKRILLFCVVSMITFSVTWAQRTVTGTVTGEDDGTAVPGVNVIVKGTSAGTVTDIDGKYQIGVPEEGGTLVFSFIGLTTEEVEIGNQSTINMVMTADIKQLTEIVVTAVGIEKNKRALGYSVSNVDGDEITQAKETNVVNALTAKVAGVAVVSSSGSPGASANIRIRGNTSINGTNSPLFVVDGTPIDNSSGGLGNGTDGTDNSNRAIDLNAADIESLTVLKGAAATALYGIRAANGAILITTKKGTPGKPMIRFSSTFTVDQVNKLPDFQTEYAQGRAINGVPTWRGPDTNEGFSWGPAISDLEFDGSEYDYDKNGRLVPAGTGNGVPAKGYDNVGSFFDNGYTYDNNISVSGGSEKSTYYMSLGWLATEGTAPNSDWQRITAKVRAETKFTDKLTVGTSASYSNTGGSRLQRGSNISGLALGLFRNSPTFDAGNGKSGQDAADDPSTYQLPDGSPRSYRGGIYDSPYWTVSKNIFDDNVNRIIGNVNAAYQFTPWLKLSGRIGMDHYTDRTVGFADLQSASFPTGSIWNVNINSTDLNSDVLLTVTKDLSEKFRINAVLGHNHYRYDYYTDITTGTDLSIEGFENISNAATTVSSSNWLRKRINGVYGDIMLEYNNYLFLNLTARNDWSSSLPKDNNSFFYPAVSLGFDFSEALGLSNGRTFSYGKLRASWGQVGNDAGIYATSSYFNSAFTGGDGFINGIQFPAFGVNAFERSNTLGNDQLKAETTTTYEFGGEFKFFQGRLGLDYTYYDKATEDQIINVNISNTSGFGGTIQNAGLIRNTGHEVMLTATPIQSGSFSWDINANWTSYQTIVEELAEGVDRIFLAGFTSASSNIIAGEPYGVLYGNGFQRDSNGKLVIGSNGWPLVDPTGDKVVGDPTPDWLGGIRNTFSYKGLSFSFLLDIRQGGDMWNGTGGIINYFGTSQQTADERNIRGYVFDGVLVGGDGEPTSTPNNIPVDFANPEGIGGTNGYKWVRYGFGGLVEENIQDASWVRLRDASISYQFPAEMLRGINISSLSLTLTGRNLFLSTKYTGVDPETNLTGASNGIGLDYFNMPNTRSFGASLSIGF